MADTGSPIPGGPAPPSGHLPRPGALPLFATLRFVLRVVIVLWVVFAGTVLALRHVVLPRVGDWHAQIEQAVSGAVGQPVRIGRLAAQWDGLHPGLVLDEVSVLDRQGSVAFSLSRVEAVLSWHSLLQRQLVMSLLAVERPVLHVRREADGRITVAGIDAEGESDPALADWVLAQRRIRIRDAMIVWEDRQRGAPPLVLEDLQFGLDNRGDEHRFGLSAAPPPALAARIDVRGEISGDFREALHEASGRVFVEVDYADLAGWRPWVDYPVDLPQGRGAVRLWGDLEAGEGRIVADLALEELQLRLGSDLPELDLVSLRGRIEGGRKGGAWSLAARKLELQTQAGVRVAPTDFAADWKVDEAAGRTGGSASASFLDIAVLADLAGYLPLDPHTRQLLERHRPQGQVNEPRISWRKVGDRLEAWSAKASFAGLGIRADGYFPGGQGLGGSLDANERGGLLTLSADQSRLSLPAVFAEPDIDFDRLQAKATWKVNGPEIAVHLERLRFEGADAAGSASGRYRYTGDGPGEIDLVAAVDRADGRAIWRYLPKVVDPEVPAWLRRAITKGNAGDAKLVLKGNLVDFPFAEAGSGTFSVTARATGVDLDYGSGWPAIEGIDADLHFGAGMLIRAERGSIFGVRLSGVVAEMADFSADEEMLLVRGDASGPTADFLRFVEESPVGETIGHFTRDIRAEGNGRLALALDIPLADVDRTKVRGDFGFLNNRIRVIEALPPVTGVSGRLQVTENGVAAREIAGNAFGGPLKVQVRTAAGQVAVTAAGQARVDEVARHFGWPLVDQLAGGAPWKAEIGIRGGNADIVVESDLVGITSPLPDPLNKVASAALPLRIERTLPDPAREQYLIRLGDIGRGVVIRRDGAWERGAIVVGPGEPQLPDRGLAVRIRAPQLDADAWRRLAPAGGNGGGNGGNALVVDTAALNVDRLRLFGRDLHAVNTTLRQRDKGWQIVLDMQEAAGELFWRSADDGLLQGRLSRLYLRPAAEAAGVDTTALNNLPAMNLVVDDLHVGELALGALQLNARNERNAWRLETLSLKNPEGTLTGRGRWRNVGNQQTRLDFELVSPDVGRLLDRLGQPGAVRRGSATLSGDLSWNGPPTGIDYPSLTGSLAVQARNGQFDKLQPGVGKLLGLISLQSLPRRLTLDFRDIFSEGFAFDSIDGRMDVARGIMRTVEPLAIRGPAAAIEIEGTTDLQAETQDLRVVVRPDVGTLTALGVAVINPIAGAATLLAGAAGVNPLNRIFSYRYHVTGTWSDPQVNKEGAIAEPGPEEKK